MGNFKEDILQVKAFVFDCDGVYTNGQILVSASNEITRCFNVKDGFATAVALKRGYPVCIISGGTGGSVEHRFTALGVQDIHLGHKDKLPPFREFLKKYNLRAEEVLFMGDDLPDLPLIRAVGIATAPADAALEVKAEAKYTSPFRGGEGCVRDVIEQVLKSQGRWRAPEWLAASV